MVRARLFTDVAPAPQTDLQLSATPIATGEGSAPADRVGELFEPGRRPRPLEQMAHLYRRLQRVAQAAHTWLGSGNFPLCLSTSARRRHLDRQRRTAHPVRHGYRGPPSTGSRHLYCRSPRSQHFAPARGALGAKQLSHIRHPFRVAGPPGCLPDHRRYLAGLHLGAASHAGGRRPRDSYNPAASITLCHPSRPTPSTRKPSSRDRSLSTGVGDSACL